MSDNSKALILLQDREVTTAAPVEKLQAMAMQQLHHLAGLQRDNALRAILLGLTLWRIKAGAAHGQFRKWLDANVTAGNIWTPATARKNASLFMRLALAFVEKSKATKPELLALPGDQTKLTLDSYEGAARKFMEKAAKFVGGSSLNELLDEHGIKDTGKKMKRVGGGDLAENAKPEQPSAMSVQDRFNELEAALLLVRKSTADKGVWMSFQKQHHADLRATARATADHIDELWAKTHGKK